MSPVLTFIFQKVLNHCVTVEICRSLQDHYDYHEVILYVCLSDHVCFVYYSTPISFRGRKPTFLRIKGEARYRWTDHWTDGPMEG